MLGRAIDRLCRIVGTRHFSSIRSELAIWRVEVGAFTMSVALSQRRRGKGSIRAALPWIGMGLCLAAFLSYLAYDRCCGKPANSDSEAASCASAGEARRRQAATVASRAD